MTLGPRGENSRRHVSARVINVLPPRARVWAAIGINALLLSIAIAGCQSGGSRSSSGIDRTAIPQSDGAIGFVV